MNVLQFLSDPALGGAGAFGASSTWQPWRVFLASCYGLGLDADGEALFRKCTGRSVYNPPPGGWREVVAICGRQSGKTRIASALVAFEAAMAEPVRDGEVYALLLGQDLRGAQRAAFSYVRSLFDASDVLRREVVRETADTLDLGNGLRIGAYPCRPASVRGIRARIAVLDELAFYRSGEGYAVDNEMLRAVRPALATTGGKLVAISSPYAQAGALFDLHKRHYGRDDSPVLVWQADAPTMNPTLPADYLARMAEDDPEAYRSEVLGEFRVGVAALFDADALDAVVVPGRRELWPVQGTRYHAFVDPSGGRRDSFALSIVHREGERAIVDLLRTWKAPFSPAGAVAEATEIVAEYRVSRVAGDKYAGEWPREAFRSHGIAYVTSEENRSELYLRMLSLVNSAKCELLDDAASLRELRGLERRTAPSGRDRVDHPSGGYDDAANAIAGALSLCSDKVVGASVLRNNEVLGRSEEIDLRTGEVLAFERRGVWYRADGSRIDPDGDGELFLSEDTHLSWRAANLRGVPFAEWAREQGGRIAAWADANRLEAPPWPVKR